MTLLLGGTGVESDGKGGAGGGRACEGCGTGTGTGADTTSGVWFCGIGIIPGIGTGNHGGPTKEE